MGEFSRRNQIERIDSRLRINVLSTMIARAEMPQKSNRTPRIIDRVCGE
jgi:hypothetical protein